MFTGLVQDLGRVAFKNKNTEGVRLGIRTNSLSADIKVDDSVSINGVCQTVTSIEGDLFFVQVVHISLEKTTLGSLKLNDEVNLELALKVSDRLGGHIVQGHVNKKTSIKRIEKYGKNYLLTMALAPEIAPYVVQEGSVAIEGISLTVASLNDESGTFTVSVIPHTWDNTILRNRKLGHEVNIEVDIFAKYIERLLVFKHKENSTEGRVPLTMDWLKSKGY